MKMALELLKKHIHQFQTHMAAAKNEIHTMAALYYTICNQSVEKRKQLLDKIVVGNIDIQEKQLLTQNRPSFLEDYQSKSASIKKPEKEEPIPKEINVKKQEKSAEETLLRKRKKCNITDEFSTSTEEDEDITDTRNENPTSHSRSKYLDEQPIPRKKENKHYREKISNTRKNKHCCEVSTSTEEEVEEEDDDITDTRNEKPTSHSRAKYLDEQAIPRKKKNKHYRKKISNTSKNKHCCEVSTSTEEEEEEVDDITDTRNENPTSHSRAKYLDEKPIPRKKKNKHYREKFSNTRKNKHCCEVSTSTEEEEEVDDITDTRNEKPTSHSRAKYLDEQPIAIKKKNRHYREKISNTQKNKHYYEVSTSTEEEDDDITDARNEKPTSHSRAKYMDDQPIPKRKKNKHYHEKLSNTQEEEIRDERQEKLPKKEKALMTITGMTDKKIQNKPFIEKHLIKVMSVKLQENLRKKPDEGYEQITMIKNAYHRKKASFIYKSLPESVKKICRTNVDITDKEKKALEKEIQKQADGSAKCVICDKSFCKSYETMRHVRSVHHHIPQYICAYGDCMVGSNSILSLGIHTVHHHFPNIFQKVHIK